MTEQKLVPIYHDDFLTFDFEKYNVLDYGPGELRIVGLNHETFLEIKTGSQFSSWYGYKTKETFDLSRKCYFAETKIKLSTNYKAVFEFGFKNGVAKAMIVFCDGVSSNRWFMAASDGLSLTTIESNVYVVPNVEYTLGIGYDGEKTIYWYIDGFKQPSCQTVRLMNSYKFTVQTYIGAEENATKTAYVKLLSILAKNGSCDEG